MASEAILSPKSFAILGGASRFGNACTIALING